VRVNSAVDHDSAHANDISRRGRIFNEDVLRRKVAIPDLVDLVISHRSETRKDERVPNLLLLNHFVYLSEQVGVVFDRARDKGFCQETAQKSSIEVLEPRLGVQNAQKSLAVLRLCAPPSKRWVVITAVVRVYRIVGHKP